MRDAGAGPRGLLVVLGALVVVAACSSSGKKATGGNGRASVAGPAAAVYRQLVSAYAEPAPATDEVTLSIDAAVPADRVHVPVAAVPIGVAYRLDGVDALQLGAPTLAKLLSGEITAWDDRAVAGDNPGVTLPSTPVLVVRTPDGDDVTRVAAAYVGKATGAPLRWATSARTVVDSAAVGSAVTATPGAIGLVDASATTATLAAVENRAGVFAKPGVDAATEAVAAAPVGDDLTVDSLDVPGPHAYPITAPVYAVLRRSYGSAASRTSTQSFVRFVLGDGQRAVTDVHAIPLPPALAAKALSLLDKVTAP